MINLIIILHTSIKKFTTRRNINLLIRKHTHSKSDIVMKRLERSKQNKKCNIKYNRIEIKFIS